MLNKIIYVKKRYLSHICHEAWLMRIKHMYNHLFTLSI